MHDFDHLLSRIERPRDFMPDCPLSHPGYEIFDHAVMTICLYQRQTYFSHGKFDILLRQLQTPPQLLKNLFQPFR
jgi:hypothetical protein